MITITLDKVLKKRERTTYWLSMQTRISTNNLGNLIKNKTQSVNFKNLDRICEALNCTPADIIEFTPNAPKRYEML